MPIPTIARALRRAAQGLRETVGRWVLDAPPGWMMGGSGVSGALKLADLGKPAENILWAYVCVMARAEAVSQVPVRLTTPAGEIIEGGPLHDLFERPNRWQDRTMFMATVEAHMTAFNEAFVVPVSETGGTPDELIALSPRNMTPIAGVHRPTGSRVAVGWVYQDGETGERHVFADDEVIVIRTPNPYNPMRSISPVDPLRRSLQMDVATREANLALFLHGGVPDLVLETEQSWGDEKAQEILERFVDRHSGVRQAHRPAILTGGLKAKTLGFRPDELQSVDVLRTLTPQEIVAGYRVKPVMAGLMVGETGLSQGTSTAEQKVAWWAEVGLAELSRIEMALQTGLVDLYAWGSRGRSAARGMTARERVGYGLRRRRGQRAPAARPGGAELWFDTNAIEELSEHRRKRLGDFKTLRDAGYPPDEISEYLDLGLPPHPTNVGLVAFSLQPVDDVGAAPGVASAPAEGAHAATDGCGCGSAAHERLTVLEALLQRADGNVTPKKYQALRKGFDTFLAPREKGAARRWSRYFLEQRKRVADRLAELREAGGRAASPLDAAAAAGLLDRIFPKGEENASLLARLSPLWSSEMQDGYAFFAEYDAPGMEATMQVEDPRVQAAIAARHEQAALANDTTADALNDILGKALADGLTVNQLADEIDGYYREHCVGETKHRPQTAARTMTAGAVNEGRLMAAEDVGGLLKGWLHGAPDEPRPAHVAAQEQYLANPIGLNERFVVNGYPCSAPGAAELPISETANCTCTLTFVPIGGAP